MTRDAVDFVTAPDPAELAAAGLEGWPYGGSGRPSQAWFDDCRARGLNPSVMVYESYSTRSQLDARFGAWDCQNHEARAREVGHTGANAVAVSDGNGADAWDASAYGQGWASVATMPFFAYGAVGVIRSFEQGAAGSLLIPGGWVPETWGSGAIASQLVGTKANLSTPHDLNRVFHDFGQEADDMFDDDDRKMLGELHLFLTEGATSTAGRVAAIQADVEALKAGASGEPLDITSVSTHDLAAELAKRV